MIKNGVVLVASLVLIDLPVSANGIFKCTAEDGAIVYQSTACNAQQQQLTVVEPRKREPEPIAPELSGAKPASDTGTSDIGPKRSLIAAEELVVGMSDTKVLNMRGWGRPRHIARQRAEDGWREEWTYGSADGAMRLVQFVNGKLAAVTSSQDGQQLARATTPRTESQQITAVSGAVPFARATTPRIESQQNTAASGAVPAQSTEQRPHEALAAAQGLMRDPPNSSRPRERTWQPGIAENTGTGKTHGASGITSTSQEPRPIDRAASVPAVQDGPTSAAAANTRSVPAASAQVQSPSVSRQDWHFVRTEAPAPAQAVGSQPHVIMQSSANRQLGRGEDTVSQ